MSETVLTPATDPEPRDEDLYRFGWRYVRNMGPDGREVVKQVPLTLEDLLHPQLGDVQLQKPIHEEIMGDLGRVFKSRLGRLRGGEVLVDCLTDWGVPGIGNTCGDVTVFEDVQIPFDPNQGLFRVEEQGGHCALVVEVSSPDTRENDVEHKVRIYERVGIPLYVIVDRPREKSPWQMIVYRLKGRKYERQVREEQNEVLLDRLNLKLFLRDNKLVCVDALTGEECAWYGQVVDQLDEARQLARQEAEGRLRAEALVRQEAEARARAEQRIRELEERLKRLEAGTSDLPPT